MLNCQTVEMEINPVIRQRQLESISQFVSESKKSLHSVLDLFNWLPEKVKENTTKVTCRHDKRHIVPTASIENHEKTCELITNGYNLKEPFLPECTDDKKHSIHIDDEKKREILSSAQKSVHNFKTGWNGIEPDPKTSDRLTSAFTSDERLALYDYAIKNTEGPTQLPEFTVVHPVKDDKELTYEELLEHERNAKRRRVKHKTVHTSNKNSSEVMREVISNQMDLYKEWLMEKESIESVGAVKRSRSKSSQRHRHRRHRRSESRHSEKYDGKRSR